MLIPRLKKYFTDRLTDRRTEEEEEEEEQEQEEKEEEEEEGRRRKRRIRRYKEVSIFYIHNIVMKKMYY